MDKKNLVYHVRDKQFIDRWQRIENSECPYAACKGHLYFMDKGFNLHILMCNECEARFIREE